MESYAHKSAKAIFATWLRESPPDKWGDQQAFGFEWRSSFSRKNGVWEEWPLADFAGIDPVWNEVGQTTDDFDSSIWKDAPPTYEELCRLGGEYTPRAILDVAVQHKGTIRFGFEITHKHALTPEKALFLSRSGLPGLAEIPASWVLGQVARPKTMPRQFWRWGSPA